MVADGEQRRQQHQSVTPRSTACSQLRLTPSPVDSIDPTLRRRHPATPLSQGGSKLRALLQWRTAWGVALTPTSPATSNCQPREQVRTNATATDAAPAHSAKPSRTPQLTTTPLAGTIQSITSQPAPSCHYSIIESHRIDHSSQSPHLCSLITPPLLLPPVQPIARPAHSFRPTSPTSSFCIPSRRPCSDSVGSLGRPCALFILHCLVSA